MVTPAEPVLKTKMEDMGNLRGPRKPAAPKSGSQKIMQPAEIIKASAEKEAPGQNPNQAIMMLSELVKRKAVQLVQLGNTLFIVMPKGGQTAEFHTATAENAKELVQRFKVLPQTLKQMGFKQAVSYSDHPIFVRMAKETGLPWKISKGMQKIQGQQKPVYQFMLDL